MKKERTEKKKDDKVKRQTEKETKLKEKQDKKTAKETAKAEKAKKKQEEKERKKAEKEEKKKAEKDAKKAKKTTGRTAKEKIDGRKTGNVKKTRKGKAERKEEPKPPKISKDECQHDDPPTPPTVEYAPAAQPEDLQGSNSQHETPLPEPKKTSPVKSRQMKRLKRMCSSWKHGLPPCMLDETAQDDRCENECEVKDECEAKDECEDEGAETGTTDKTTDLKDSEPAKRKKRKNEDCEEESKVKATKEAKGTKSKKAEKVEKKKTGIKGGTKADQTLEKTSKTRKTKEKKQKAPKVEYEVNLPAKGLIIETLKECQNTNCTHPNFVVPTLPLVQCSTYWTRAAVGVKIPGKFKGDEVPKTKKGRKSEKSDEVPKSGKGRKTEKKDLDWCQVAYFGGPTCPCTYAAWVTAGIYVSRMHPRTSTCCDSIYDLFHQMFIHAYTRYISVWTKFHLTSFTTSIDIIP